MADERDRVVIEFVAELSKARAGIEELRRMAKNAGAEIAKAGGGGKKPPGDLGPEAAWWAALTKRQREEMKNRIANHQWAVKQHRGITESQWKWEQANIKKAIAWGAEARRLSAREEQRAYAEAHRIAAQRAKEQKEENARVEAAMRQMEQAEKVRQKRLSDANKKQNADNASYQMAKRRASAQERRDADASIARTNARDTVQRRTGRAEVAMQHEIRKGYMWLTQDQRKSIDAQIAGAKAAYQAQMKAAQAIKNTVKREQEQTKALRELGQAYRDIGSDARKMSTDSRLRANDSLWNRALRAAFGVTSIVRMFRYWGWILMDFMRGVGDAVRFVINAFVTLIKTWVNVVAGALKLGAAIGGVLAGGLALATKVAIGFETAMARVGGVVGKTLEQMPELAASVREIGKRFGMAAEEIAQAAFQLASFGYSTRQTGAMLPGVTLLARSASGETGGRADTERSAEVVARMLMVWQRPAEEATRVANLLAAANAQSAATFEKLFTSMPKAAQAANLVKMNMEELVGTLSQFYNAGLSGEQAGSALLGLIVRLISPTEEFKKVIESHGVAYATVNPAVVGFRKALQNLVSLGLDPTEIATFRNRNGLIALNILVKQGVVEHDRLTQAITGTNQAQKQSDIMLNTVSGQWDRFKSTLRDFGITIGDKVRAPLKWLLGTLSNWLDSLGNTPQVKALANAIGEAAWAVARLATGLLKMVDIRKAFPQFIDMLVGYMRRAADVIVRVVAVFEYAFRSVADENSPLRMLWSSFWDFVVWSVEQATALIAGGIAGLKQLLANLFSKDMTQATEEWGTTFVALIAEAMSQARQVVMYGVADMGDIIATWMSGNDLWKFFFGYNPESLVRYGSKQLREAASIEGTDWAKDILSNSSSRFRAVYDEQHLAARVREQQRRMEVMGSPEWQTATEEQRKEMLSAAGTDVFRGVWSSAKSGYQGWLGKMRDIRGGGLAMGLPVASAVAGGANNIIGSFQRGLKQAWAGGALPGGGDGMFFKGEQDPDAIAHELQDGTDATQKNTEALKDNTSVLGAFDGIIAKIIGAPMETINRYVSPASFALATGTPSIGTLMGMPGGPGNIVQYQTFNFNFGNGVKESFKYEITQGQGARLIRHEVTSAFQSAIPALRGGGR